MATATKVRNAVAEACWTVLENFRESHAEMEFEDRHGGDVDHQGPAPEDCSR